MLAKGFIVSALLCAFSLVNALPVEDLEQRASVTALTTAQITPYRPFTHFASTAYCNPSVTKTWTCGGTDIRFCVH